tara:strand:+ start:1018 stop:1590 length:573 start_codon:yes stop_codon:yes gene_type:complete
MKLVKYISAFGCSLTVVGCASINYIEPTTGEISRVRFVTNDTNRVTVNLYETADCKKDSIWMTLRNGPLIDPSPKSLNMPLSNYHKNSFKEFYVESNKERIIVIWGFSSLDMSASLRCGVPVNLSFLKPNRDYELFYEYGAYGCSVSVSELVSSSESPPKKQSITVLKNAQNDVSSSCMAEFSREKFNIN